MCSVKVGPRATRKDLGVIKMKILKLIIVLIFLGTSAIAVDTEIIARQAAIDQFVYHAPLFIKDRSLPALRNLDQLKAEQVNKKPNPLNPGKDVEFRTFLYEGLEIYGAVLDQKELAFIRITITDPRWQILNDLNIGSSVERIESFLGKPTKEYSNIRQYCGETECVNFHIKDSKIIKVELNYYFD